MQRAPTQVVPAAPQQLGGALVGVDDGPVEGVEEDRDLGLRLDEVPVLRSEGLARCLSVFHLVPP